MFELLNVSLSAKILPDNRFIGEVPGANFITGSDLATQNGLTSGTAINDSEPWLFYRFNSTKYYIPKKPIRHSISWDNLNTLSLIYGNRIRKIGNEFYSIRLLKGAISDPAFNDSGWDVTTGNGSEWNKFFYHIHGPSFADPSNSLRSEGITVGEWAGYSDDDLGMSPYVENPLGHMNLVQEKSSDPLVVTRGYIGVSRFDTTQKTSSSSIIGWRPVLEQIAPFYENKVSYLQLLANTTYGDSFVWNNDVYYIGDKWPSGSTVSLLRRYDFLTNTFVDVTTTGTVPTAVNNIGVSIINNKLYLFGGTTSIETSMTSTNAYVLDLDTLVWTAISNIPEPLYKPKVVACLGKIYILAGRNGVSNDIFYEYDPLTNGYVKKPSTLEAGSGNPVGMSITTDDRYVYVQGGYYNRASALLKRYDPTASTWVNLANRPTGTYDGTMGYVQGYLFTLGGQTSINKLYIYDIAKNGWVDTLVQLPTGRGNLVTCNPKMLTRNGKLYAFTNIGFIEIK